MTKNTHIIVVEPSGILYEGLIHILAQSGLPFQSRQAAGLTDAEKLICSRPDSVVIMNPSVVQNKIREFQTLKNTWDRAHWIAFTNILYDQHTLSFFDEVITIYDTPAIAASSIKKVLSDEPAKEQDLTGNLLSDREVEVLQLLAAGLSNKEIADKLNISVNTVITHRKNISQKTGIRTISGLTIYAVVNKMINIDSVH